MNKALKGAVLFGCEPQEARNYIARLSIVPTGVERSAIIALFRSLKSAGLLSALDALYIGAATAADTLLNAISATGTATATNSPAWTKYRGYTGNGSNASLNSNINPSTASGLHYTKDAASIFAFMLSQPGNTGAVIGRNASPGYSFIVPYTSAGRMQAAINGDSGGYYNSNATNPIKNGLGLSAIVRESATTIKMYKGASLIATGAVNSTEIPNGTIRGLSGNGLFTDGELGAWGFGGALTAYQVAVLNSALTNYFAALGVSATDPVTPYGAWRGTWNTGGNAIGGSVPFVGGDVVLYSGGYYFCISDYTTGAASTAPDVDTTHWEPLPLFAEADLFEDTFNSGAGAFVGRGVGALTWLVTGDGYLNAEVVVPVDGDGYATSYLNTYYVMPSLPSVPTEWGAESMDSTEPRLTLALGGTATPGQIFNEMLHINFQTGGAHGLYWHDGALSQSLSDASKYIKLDSSITVNGGSRHRVAIKIRGTFVFGFLNEALVYTACADIVATIASVATELYIQNQDHPDSTPSTPYALGDQRHYRVWAKKAA